MQQVLLIASLLAACWLGMQAVHEAGHVLGALSTGGSVEFVELHPLRFSRTDVGHNPHPMIVVWAGPLFGCLAPLLAWGAAAAARVREAFLLRFFAGFCLVANGAYIGGGSFAGDGDCGEMLRLGAPLWTLWVFGAAAALPGLAVWHGQGKDFGIGPGSRITRRAVLISIAAVLFLLALSLPAVSEGAG